MQTERERIVQGRMFRYAEYRREIEEFVARAMQQTAKSRDAVVQSSFISDPTARGGIMLADPPPKIAEKIAWCEVVDDTRNELADEPVMLYVMEHNFGIDGEPHPREKNGECRKAICEYCGISESTFYMWLERITNIALYHAGRRGLV